MAMAGDSASTLTLVWVTASVICEFTAVGAPAELSVEGVSAIVDFLYG
jgi:hypothetical protein